MKAATSDQAPEAKQPKHIQRIVIEGLFGHLDHTIEPRHSEGAVSNLMILYGDNGSGKTTILRLLFALLEPRPRPASKSYLARTPFTRFEILFSEGTTIAVSKEALLGSYTAVIHRSGHPAETFFLKAGENNAIHDEKPNDYAGFLSALSRIELGLYFVPDDRRVLRTFGGDGDEIAAEWAVAMLDRGSKPEPERGRRESHHLDITPVMIELGASFRGRALQGSTAGDETATSIYLRVSEQISALAGVRPDVEGGNPDTIITRLQAIASQIDKYVDFGLMSPFPAERFVAVYSASNADARRAMATVLAPFIDGIEARLRALRAVRDVIATYLDTANAFLKGKSMRFSMKGGARIFGYGNTPLSPKLLSSGERQLILLLTNIVLVRDRNCLFLVDEPELSLNIKWQRKLVTALLDCAAGTNLQYILASHSLELINKHRDNAIRLDISADSEGDE